MPHHDVGAIHMAIVPEPKRHRDDARRRFDPHPTPAGAACRVQESGEDSQAVTGLFCVAAVGVVDSQAEVRSPTRCDRQQTVAADPPVTVAQSAHDLRRERNIELGRVDRDVIVAQAVALEIRVSQDGSNPIIRRHSRQRRAVGPTMPGVPEPPDITNSLEELEAQPRGRRTETE